jgi:hypothetical protein
MPTCPSGKFLTVTEFTDVPVEKLLERKYFVPDSAATSLSPLAGVSVFGDAF